VRAHLRGFHLEEAKMDLRPGEKVKDLRFEMRKIRIGSLSLRVRDAEGRPVEGLSVMYGRVGGKRWRSARAESPEPGLYRADDIEAGTWTLAVYRKDLGSRSTEVEIRENEVTELEMDLTKQE
jgi:hypothetical protein